MDKIDFTCLKSDIEDYMTTVIYVNGINLKNVIEEIETAQLAKKDLFVQNGCYEGICFFIAFQYKNHFLGKTLNEYIYEGQRYTLYDYKCSGIPGDHSLACKISIKSKEIIWHDFKNFSKVIPYELDYKDLEFHFCKEQYLHAINSAKNNTNKNVNA